MRSRKIFTSLGLRQEFAELRKSLSQGSESSPNLGMLRVPRQSTEDPVDPNKDETTSTSIYPIWSPDSPDNAFPGPSRDSRTASTDDMDAPMDSDQGERREELPLVDQDTQVTRDDVPDCRVLNHLTVAARARSNLFDFLMSHGTELMRLSNLKPDISSTHTPFWITGGDPSCLYQHKIGSGTSGDVFLV